MLDGNQMLSASLAAAPPRAGHFIVSLYGDVVEPRREFIQQNALSVENLDF